MSERSETKARLHEKALDQVALDKLQGLEHGHTCYLKYREAQKKHAANQKPAAQSRRRGPPRAVSTYRGAKEGPRKSQTLRAERKANGLSRRQQDYQRWLARQPMREAA